MIMQFHYNVIERNKDKELLYQLDYDIDCPYLRDTKCWNPIYECSHKLCIYADTTKVIYLPPYNFKYCPRYEQYEINARIKEYYESETTYDSRWYNTIDWLRRDLKHAEWDEEFMFNERWRPSRYIIHISDMQRFLNHHPDIRPMTVIKNSKNSWRPEYLYIKDNAITDTSNNQQYKKIKCLHCGKEVYSHTNYCFECLKYENFESK